MKKAEIWVFLEHDGNNFEDVSLELLGAARNLADKFGHIVTGIILGQDASGLPEDAIRYGADHAILIKHELLNEYGTELFTKAVADLSGNRRPDILLVGATRNGRDLAARVAARLRTGLAANVVTLDIDGEGVLYSGVPGYGSKIIASILCTKNRPQMSTVRSGIFHARNLDGKRKGEIEVVEPDLDGVKNRVKVMSRITEDSKDITGSAQVIVAGNGIARDMEKVEKLSEVTGADIGVTRPVADRGLFPREMQVGSTGISLKADHALILGSSGSEHFITGISNCKTVISIDTDPKSGIFDYSDYCIVGDASKIISEIIRKLEVIHR